jgi:hypothetical protein
LERGHRNIRMLPLSTLKTGECCFVVHIENIQHLHNSHIATHLTLGCRLTIISHLGSLVIRQGMKLFAIDHGLADHIHVIQIPSKSIRSSN